MFGNRTVTLPFSDYCDPLVSDLDSWRCLTEALLASGDPMVVRCVHCDVPLADPRFSTFKRAKWHGLDLAPDLDALWGALDRKCRHDIKHAQRVGVTVRWATESSDLRAFFEMHLAVRKYKYGMLAQPFAFFENIWRRFVERGEGYLLLSTYDDKVVGGVLLLRWEEHAGSQIQCVRARRPRPSAERPDGVGIDQPRQSSGCARFDFGLSDWDQEGLVRFKRKFSGTREKTISFLNHAPSVSPAPYQSGARGLLADMTRVFVDPLVPDAVTERAGADLYRFFV